VRKQKADQVAGLQGEMEKFQSENTQLNALVNQLRADHKKMSQQLADALETRRAAEEECSYLREQSAQEIEAHTKLADLYKV